MGIGQDEYGWAEGFEIRFWQVRGQMIVCMIILWYNFTRIHLRMYYTVHKVAYGGSNVLEVQMGVAEQRKFPAQHLKTTKAG